jgi:hypothetical protein
MPRRLGEGAEGDEGIPDVKPEIDGLPDPARIAREVPQRGQTSP